MKHPMNRPKFGSNFYWNGSFLTTLVQNDSRTVLAAVETNLVFTHPCAVWYLLVWSCRVSKVRSEDGACPTHRKCTCRLIDRPNRTIPELAARASSSSSLPYLLPSFPFSLYHILVAPSRVYSIRRTSTWIWHSTWCLEYIEKQKIDSNLYIIQRPVYGIYHRLAISINVYFNIIKYRKTLFIEISPLLHIRKKN